MDGEVGFLVVRIRRRVEGSLVIWRVDAERRWAAESVEEEGLWGHEMVGIVRAGDKMVISGIWKEKLRVLKGLVTERDDGFERRESC